MRISARSWRAHAAVVAAGVVAIAGAAVVSLASDHQDTPEVELNPRMDINDVYAFPGPSADRITLVMTTSSPIIGTDASFDPNLLYQLRIDNTGDAVEDKVIQVTFKGMGASQTVQVRGPVAPVEAGMRSKLSPSSATVSGAVGQVLTGGDMKVYAGLRGDPFFIDLEQFFKILPDRRPSTGSLSGPPTQEATSFRTPGVDLLGTVGANCLAIVIELPTSALVAGSSADDKFGLWATISR